MSEPFLIAKAVDVSGNALGKATSIVIKGLAVLAIIGLFFWMAYVTFVKPHTNPTPSTTQNAQQITNNYYYQIPMKRTFGLALTLWGGDIGFVKYTYDKPVLVKTETITK
jgi:hypothetical protein